MTANGGERFCSLEEWLPLSVRHGLVREVTTITITATGAANATITLDAGARSVLDAKEEIARTEGIPVPLQQMYLVLMREDGEMVREDDGDDGAGAELLDVEQLLHGNKVVVVAAEDAPQPNPWWWPAGSLSREAAALIPLTEIELQGELDPQFRYPVGLDSRNREHPPLYHGPRYR
jgi:hypothetical protein